MRTKREEAALEDADLQATAAKLEWFGWLGCLAIEARPHNPDNWTLWIRGDAADIDWTSPTIRLRLKRHDRARLVKALGGTFP